MAVAITRPADAINRDVAEAIHHFANLAIKNLHFVMRAETSNAISRKRNQSARNLVKLTMPCFRNSPKTSPSNFCATGETGRAPGGNAA